MDAVEGLGLLRLLGLTLTPEDGRLIVQPVELLDSDTRWLIRKFRDELMALLVNDCHAPFTHSVNYGKVATPQEVKTANLEQQPNSSAERINMMAARIESDPGLRYAMETHDNTEPEAVILTLAIRGKGACELRIPKSRYDGIALLELIEKYTKQETLQ